jgi:hypothetical protein
VAQARAGRSAAASRVRGEVGLGVPRLQCRQACGPAGIPEPGLAGRLGGPRWAEMPRLAMKLRAPGCIEVEQGRVSPVNQDDRGCGKFKRALEIGM